MTTSLPCTLSDGGKFGARMCVVNSRGAGWTSISSKHQPPIPPPGQWVHEGFGTCASPSDGGANVKWFSYDVIDGEHTVQGCQDYCLQDDRCATLGTPRVWVDEEGSACGVYIADTLVWSIGCPASISIHTFVVDGLPPAPPLSPPAPVEDALLAPPGDALKFTCDRTYDVRSAAQILMFDAYNATSSYPLSLSVDQSPPIPSVDAVLVIIGLATFHEGAASSSSGPLLACTSLEPVCIQRFPRRFGHVASGCPQCARVPTCF